MLDDYQGALENLDNANVLELNNAFSLRSRVVVKTKLDDYQGALVSSLLNLSMLDLTGSKSVTRISPKNSNDEVQTLPSNI